MPEPQEQSPFDLLREADAIIDQRESGAPGVPFKPTINNLSIRHDLILNWLIANPHRPMRECAQHFNVTQSWLSIIVHSDVFQARLKDRQDELFAGTVMDTRAKLETLAHVSLDRLTEAVEQSDDPEFLLDAADKALHRLGYAPRTGSASAPTGAGTNTQININIDRATLSEAQQLMGAVRQLVPQPEALPSADEGPQPAAASDEDS